MSSDTIQITEQAFLANHVGIWLYDPVAGKEQWSKGLCRMFKIAEDQEKQLFRYFPELKRRLDSAMERRWTMFETESGYGVSERRFSFAFELHYQDDSSRPRRRKTNRNASTPEWTLTAASRLLRSEFLKSSRNK